jgi:pimeloyl-ACP methyl ester carboxylesterase
MFVGIGTCQEAKPNTDSPPAPEELTAETKDGLSLHVTYYPGSEGKKTVPLIVLHGVDGPMGEGSGRDCAGLASFLQQKKHAVFVPDLRGFGASKVRRTPDGERATISADRLRTNDVAAMVDQDLEAVKRLVLERHNRGDLNVSLLCVVGFDLGAVVGLNWVDLDWSAPILPNLKQGRDVIGMVLVSPLNAYKGISTRDALENPDVRADVSAMVVFGAQHAEMASVGRRLHKTLQRFHAPLPKDKVEQRKKQDLFLTELPTSLQGTKLLTSSELGLARLIEEFIQLRIVALRDDYPWRSRARK